MFGSNPLLKEVSVSGVKTRGFPPLLSRLCDSPLPGPGPAAPTVGLGGVVWMSDVRGLIEDSFIGGWVTGTTQGEDR